MHLIVPFASPWSDAGRDTLSRLATPTLDALLARCVEVFRDTDDESSLTPPHERAYARALGWSQPGSAPLPWAARQALTDGIDVGDRPWGLLTPVHWRVGADAIHLADPRALALDESSSRALLDAVRPLFEDEGIALIWGAPLRWYASHPSLASLTTASLDRVVGRNVDRWLPAQREARVVRRLQNEVQMLLYTHPINAAREDAGALPVNSFWLSGCGIAQAEVGNDAQFDDRLREGAVVEDWPAWTAAWTALDADLSARPLTRLTLCGERGAATFASAEPTLWQRLARPFTTPRPARELLATL